MRADLIETINAYLEHLSELDLWSILAVALYLFSNNDPLA